MTSDFSRSPAGQGPVNHAGTSAYFCSNSRLRYSFPFPQSNQPRHACRAGPSGGGPGGGDEQRSLFVGTRARSGAGHTARRPGQILEDGAAVCYSLSAVIHSIYHSAYTAAYRPSHSLTHRRAQRALAACSLRSTRTRSRPDRRRDGVLPAFGAEAVPSAQPWPGLLGTRGKRTR